MRVAQVLFSGLGGHGSVAFSLVRGDRARAHEHRMLFYGIEPLASGYAELCGELDVTYDVVTKQPGLDLGSWRAVVRALHRFAPDVIILHSLTLIVPAAAYARYARVPLVAVDHLSVDVKQRRDWAFTLMALNAADRTIVLTPEFASRVGVRLGRLHRPERLEVIGNGIDLDAFARSEVGRQPAPGRLRVGMHGRFSPSKDYATLLRAVAKLEDIQLSLAGGGETLAATRALAGELGISARCEFLGMLPERELPAYLHSLDLYVQSSWGEAMSTAVMQAMAAGLPVVASEVAGLSDMVEPGVTGELFCAGDADALAGALERLASDVLARVRLGRAAVEHARRHWSHETMFGSYEALMSTLFAEATSRKTSA